MERGWREGGVLVLVLLLLLLLNTYCMLLADCLFTFVGIAMDRARWWSLCEDAHTGFTSPKSLDRVLEFLHLILA